MHRVLCIDECSETLNALCFSLAGAFDLNVHPDPQEALGIARRWHPHAVVLDPVFNLNPVALSDYLVALKALPSKPCVIILRQHIQPWLIDILHAYGADAFLSKPWDDNWLRIKIASVIANTRSAPEPSPKERPYAVSFCEGLPVLEAPGVSLNHPHPVFDALCGSSQVMKEVRNVLSLFADEDKPVLIRGETGTGKTVAAQLLHRASTRRNRPFVARNVAAIPETLVYAELFGCEQGAFTGAMSRKGSIADAEGGTLFLDEIGDASKELQMSLLRFLDSGCYYPLGSVRQQRADVRLICATNRPMDAMVKNRSFRMDLWYRLQVLLLELPPLDAHREDIPELFHYWCRRERVDPALFDGELLSWLERRHWEGNVREFFNVLDRLRVHLRLRKGVTSLHEFKAIAKGGWVSECDGSRDSAIRG